MSSSQLTTRKSMEYEDISSMLGNIRITIEPITKGRGSLPRLPKEQPRDENGNIYATPVSIVLSSKFLEEASHHSRKSFPIQKIQDEHLGLQGANQKKKASRLPWQRMIRTPLGTFLTGVYGSYPWVQLAGHKGNFLPGPAGTIYKKGSEMERAALEELTTDVLKPMVPLYYKDVKMGEEGELYLEMQDLLSKFDDPCVMDVKMGIRTFLESEVRKETRRTDLLLKMVALDENEPTEEERANGITKLRYMSFRERLSSTKTMGFRVEGIKLASAKPRTDFKLIKHRHEVQEALMSFLPTDEHNRADIAQKIVERLHELRSTLDISEFFKTHELIGSSLLFIYDWTGKVGVWMIDFGKTSRVDKPLTHHEKWILGNREDGYLIGLDNITEIFSEATAAAASHQDILVHGRNFSAQHSTAL